MTFSPPFIDFKTQKGRFRGVTRVILRGYPGLRATFVRFPRRVTVQIFLVIFLPSPESSSSLGKFRILQSWLPPFHKPIKRLDSELGRLI